MKTRYLLYTEDLGNSDQLSTIVNCYFDGCTFHNGNRGIWQGISEASLIIELITDNPQDDKIDSLVNDIKRINSQESVMVITDNVNAKFL